MPCPVAGVDYIGVSTPFYCHDEDNNFLFHKRSPNCRDEQGVWDPGSGQLEFGLTPEENVMKELMEEYGCGGIIEKQLPPHSILRMNKGKRTHWLAIPHIVLVDPKDVKLNDPVSMKDLGWFKLDKLPSPMHTGFLFTTRHYPEYFETYK